MNCEHFITVQLVLDVRQVNLSVFMKLILAHRRRSSGMSLEEEGSGHQLYDRRASHKHLSECDRACVTLTVRIVHHVLLFWSFMLQMT